MFSRVARQSLRTTLRKRTFVDGWVKGKNNIRGVQQLYQDPAKSHLHGADDPTYLKAKGDGVAATVGAVLFGCSLVAVTRGMWNMSHGTGKL